MSSLIEKLEKSGGTVLGNLSSGEVVSFSYDLADKVFNEFKDETTDTGMKSFLSSLGIPTGFFKERHPVLQENLVVDTKGSAKIKKNAEEFLVYVIDDLIHFVAPHNETFGWESPEDVLGIDRNYWDLIGEDFNSGQFRYFCSFDKACRSSDFVPGVFVRVPIFYGKPLIIESGMFCYNTQSSIIDHTLVEKAVIKLTLEQNSLQVVKEFFKKVPSENEYKLKDMYNSIMNYLKVSPIPDMNEFLFNVIKEKPCLLPKFLANKIKTHIKKVRKGKEVPENTIQVIENAYELLYTMMIYSSNSEKPLASEVNVNKKAFAFFLKFFGCMESDRVNCEFRIENDVLVYNIARP